MAINFTQRLPRLLCFLLLAAFVASTATGCGMFTRDEDDNGDNGENGNGGNGENGSNGEVTIYDVRDPARRARLDSLSEITLENLVVTTVRGRTVSGDQRYDMYVQHLEGGPYSAIQLEAVSAPAQPGDILTVTGGYKAYFGMDQLGGVTFEVTGTTDVPEPETFDDSADLATGGTASYEWQSALVRVTDVSVTEPRILGSDDQWRGDFAVDGDLIVGRLFRHEYQDPRAGDQFSSISGILTHSFEHSRLQPRFNLDMVFADGTSPGPGEPSDVTIRDVRDPELRAALGDGPFTVEGIVTTTRSRGQRFDLFIQSPDARPWDAIMVFNATTDAEPGDLVQVTGSYGQHHGMDQLTSVTNVTVLERGGEIPEPLPVDSSLIATSSDAAFSYQALLLEVSDVTVTEFPIAGDGATWTGDFRVTGDLIVGTHFYHDYRPVLGDELDSVVGVLRFTYDEFRLEPRSNEDILLGDGTNPGPVEPATVTVYDIRDPELRALLHSLTGLTLEEMVVTAVRSYTFNEQPRYDMFVQHPDGGPYSAIQLWSVPTHAAPGDVLKITGNYDSYFGMDQLKAVSFEITGSTAVPEPVLFEDPSLIATGGEDHHRWQSALVRVQSVAVTEPRLLGSDGQWRGDFVVDGDLVVGRLLRHDYDAEENDSFASITGVLNYDWNESRLQPRLNADIVFRDGTSPSGD